MYDQDNSKNIGNANEIPINISSSQINNEDDNESNNKELSTNVNNQNIKLTEFKNQNEINQKIKESLELYQHDLINNNKNVHRFMDFTFPKENIILKNYEEEKLLKDINNNKKVKVKKNNIKLSNNKKINKNEPNLKIIKNKNNIQQNNNKYNYKFRNYISQNNNNQNKGGKDLNSDFFSQKKKKIIPKFLNLN